MTNRPEYTENQQWRQEDLLGIRVVLPRKKIISGVKKECCRSRYDTKCDFTTRTSGWCDTDVLFCCIFMTPTTQRKKDRPVGQSVM